MSKTNNKRFSPFKGFFASLSVLAILGSLLAGVSYFNQDLENNSNLAQAALNCPAGSTLSGSQCISSTPSSYTCPGGQSVSGTSCVATVQTGTSYSCPSGGAYDGGASCVAGLGSPVVLDPMTACPPNTGGGAFGGFPNQSVFNGYRLCFSYPVNSGIGGTACNGSPVSGNIGPEYYCYHSVQCGGGGCYGMVVAAVRYVSYSYAATGTPTYGPGVVGSATPVYGTPTSPTSYTPDAGQITGITCDNTSPVVGSNITCTVVGTGAPSGVPYGGSVTLSVDNGGATSTCTFTGSATTTCAPVNVGNTVGAKTVTTSSGGSLAINVIKVNFGKVDWVFSPDQGGTGPLFRSSDSTTVTIKNFRTSTDLTPSSDTRYTCTLEYRGLVDRLSTAVGTGLSFLPLNTSITIPKPYITTVGINQGCTFNLTKQQRANVLNHSLKLTITDTTVINPSASNPNTYIFYNEYIYRFQGAGMACSIKPKI